MTVRAILSDPGYQNLKAYVLERTGLAYYQGKDEDLATRLLRRISALKIRNCPAYLDLLKSGPELDSLASELTIGETYFFRQREHFDLLRSTIIPDLLRRNADTRQLRIWSAGCATGAEPYSIAILLRSEFAEALQSWNVEILGTDLNPDFLELARQASYTEWALRDVPADVRAACFTREGKRWILHSEYRFAVHFRQHNLAVDDTNPSPSGSPFDLILCRNVLIYFSREGTRSVVAQFFHRLNPLGWLILGHAECSAENFREFAVVQHPHVIVFRKPAGEEPVDTAAAPYEPYVFETPHVEPSHDDSPQFAPVVDPSDAVEDIAATPPAVDTLDQARLFADRGHWTQARALCEQLLADDPLNAAAHFTLGLILSHTGSVEEAKAALRRAIYVDRQFALAYYHLGTLLQQTGNGAEMQKAFSNVMTLLDGRPPGDPLEYGDGIKVEELKHLTRMHQEILL